MPSSSVARNATSTSDFNAHKPARIPRKVLGVHLLGDAGVITLKVPSEAKLATLRINDVPTLTVQFYRLVKGGRINFHILSENVKYYAGARLYAKAQIFRKDLQDGESFLYVVLEPVEAKVTNRLVVMDGSIEIPKRDDFTVFESPHPLRGSAIILTPVDAKITPA